MSEKAELSSFDSALEQLLRKMGIAHPAALAELLDRWEELAGSPWAGRSRPVVVEGKTLVVEAAVPSMVAYLRYGMDDLLERVARVIGPGLIERIEVRPPARR